MRANWLICRLWPLAVLFSIAHTVHSQAEQGALTLKARARIVEVSADVTSKTGAPAENLTKDDFLIREDGKNVPIQFFSRGSSKAIITAILVDTSGSQRDFVEDEIRAADLLIEGLLSNGENEATLVQFDTGVLEHGGLTVSASTLSRELPSLRSRVPLSSNHPPRPGGWTVLHDAVHTTAQYIFPGKAGRKVMVVLTDGCDFNSQKTLAEAIEEAQRVDAKIYSILYTDTPEQRCTEELHSLSKSTGGSVYTVSKKQTLRSILMQIQRQLRDSYELGYIPSKEIKANTYHGLEIKTKYRHLIVHARDGYYADP